MKQMVDITDQEVTDMIRENDPHRSGLIEYQGEDNMVIYYK